MTRVSLAGLVAGIVLALGTATSVHAAVNVRTPPAPTVMKNIIWPDAPCTVDNRMDVAIVDGMFFECQCLALASGFQCDWYLIAGVDEITSLRKYTLKRKIRKPRPYLRRGVWVTPVMRIRVPA